MEDQKNETTERLDELGSGLTRNDKGSIYTLTIIGQIEGHQVAPDTVKTTKYEHVLPLLATIEESEDIDGLLLLLNTVGGDIEAGLAIAELIAGMRKPTVSLVLGGGHSACGFCQKKHDCSDCKHDDPSGQDERCCGRGTCNIPLFSENSGANHRFRHCEF